MEEDNECNTWAAELNLFDKKPVRLSLKMMIRRHLPLEAESWDQEQIIGALNKITHLRLDRENIKEIDNLELLGPNVTNVYLQRNHISKIDNLGCLSNLMFLTLAGNQIRMVENLTSLSKLSLLDLSDNLIETFDIDEFPQSLVILNLKNNPCTTKPDHRGSIIQELACLRQLNGVEVSREERVEAGHTVTSDESDEGETVSEVEDTHLEPHIDYSSEKIEQEGDDTVKYMANNILLRSQERLEDLMKEHQQRAAEMNSVRSLFSLPPRSARSRNSARADI